MNEHDPTAGQLIAVQTANGLTIDRAATYGRRKAATPWIIDGYALIVGREFRGDNLGQVAAVSIRAGAVGVTFERCLFINCYRIEILGGIRIRFIECENIFERSLAHPPSVLLSQYNWYIGGGTDIGFHRCYAFGSRLDNYKAAIGASYITIDECIGEESGVSPAEALQFGCTSQAGDSIDGYGSGNRMRITKHTGRGNYGAVLILKTNIAQNPPSVVGDVLVSDMLGEDTIFGICYENIEGLDTPSGPDFPGDRPDARHLIVNGARFIRPIANALYLNGRNATINGLHVTDSGEAAIVLYVSARDVDIVDPQLLRSSSGINPNDQLKYDQAAIRIVGARDFSIRHGVIDGGPNATQRSPIEVFDYDATHLAGDFLIDRPRMRAWRASGSPPILFTSATVGGICHTIGNGAPSSSPGRHGSPGSTHTNTADGRIWRQTGAANTNGSWV